MDAHPPQVQTSAQSALRAHHVAALSRYTLQQQSAALRLYKTAKAHTDTGGGSTCAKLLLGLYNGDRFKFDLTDLRRLDNELLDAAIIVLHMDAAYTWCEIHVLLNAIQGHVDKCTGATMELWAQTLRLKGRCSREHIADLKARAA